MIQYKCYYAKMMFHVSTKIFSINQSSFIKKLQHHGVLPIVHTHFEVLNCTSTLKGEKASRRWRIVVIPRGSIYMDTNKW